LAIIDGALFTVFEGTAIDRLGRRIVCEGSQRRKPGARNLQEVSRTAW